MTKSQKLKQRLEAKVTTPNALDRKNVIMSRHYPNIRLQRLQTGEAIIHLNDNYSTEIMPASEAANMFYRLKKKLKIRES